MMIQQVQSIGRFSTTIAIFSGAPRFDQMAGKILHNLQTASTGEIKFVGTVGTPDQHQLEAQYPSNSIMDHDEYVITRHYNSVVQNSVLVPYRTNTIIRSYLWRRKLIKDEVIQDLQGRNVNAVITVGSYSFLKLFYSKIAEEYQKVNRWKPLMLGFDLSIEGRTIHDEKFLDFMYYQMPKLPQNRSKYVFPSMCFGYDCLFETFRFLQQYRQDPSNSSFFMKDFSYEVSQLVKKARSQYRAENSINQDQYLTYVSLGSSEHEIKFSGKALKDGFAEFAANSSISSVNNDFFKLVVELPSDEKLAAAVKSQVSGLASKYEVRFVEESVRYAAMCASDFAIVHNGDVAVEIAACQLPATVISSISNVKAYVYYLYNGHDSPLNVSTNYEGYQDLMGSMTAMGTKIGSIMVDHFERPKLRYYYVKLYRNEIQKMLSLNGRNPNMDVSRNGLQVAAQDILQKVEEFAKMKDTGYQGVGPRRQTLNFFI